MNKNCLLKLLSVVCLMIFMIACENESEEGSPYSNLYSNKLSAQKGGNLVLTYCEKELIGKDIRLEIKDKQTASLTLYGILPGEKETQIDPILVSLTNDCCTFQGNTQSHNGTTFDYNGKISGGKLALDLRQVKLADTALTGTWQVTPYNNNPGNISYPFYAILVSGDNLLSNILQPIGNKYIACALRDVTFGEDGNITANYHSVSDVDLMDNTLPLRPDSAWTKSPVNVATYFVKDSLLTILPQVDMIVQLIQNNTATPTRADNETSISMETIRAIYVQLNQWTTTGIPLVIRKGSNGREGEITLILKKEEIQAFFPLLPLIKALLPADIQQGFVGKLISSILENLPETLQKPESQAEFGICLEGQTK